MNPWILLILGDDGTWVRGPSFLERAMADHFAEAYEGLYGNRTEVLGRW